MLQEISSKIILIITIIIISFVYIIYHFYTLAPFSLRAYRIDPHHSLYIGGDNQGWISSSLHNQLRSYMITREHIIGQIPRRIHIEKNNITVPPLNYDYMEHIHNTNSTTYPYSTWTCSNTSNTDLGNSDEYCIVQNIYYKSSTDQYYFYLDPSRNKTIIPRILFKTPYDQINFEIIENLTLLQTPISTILKRPILLAAPPDLNYAHGFLELCGPRFWVLAECQSHASYVNPKTAQIYYTSTMFEGHSPNWSLYERQTDGSYRPVRHWEQMVQSMFSIYPLLIHTSFNRTTVMFKYMIFPGRQLSRSAAWGYNYLMRKFPSYPLSTQHYRRAYLAYSEWILYHLNLQSKFQLTASQEELQENKLSERIRLCNQTCELKQPNVSVENYSGEWIVVLNRHGFNNRAINNAKHLVQALLRTFPDHSNPYLRVWPEQFFFGDNFYETVRMSRSIRVLIGVHGAGLSNAVFMRPGAILYEINPYGCRELSFNFRRWAEVFNLQHALWIPSSAENGNQDDVCRRESAITLNIKEIIDEVKNLLRNEVEYRTGYWKRALDIMNDGSIVDYPPPGYEHILA